MYSSHSSGVALNPPRVFTASGGPHPTIVNASSGVHPAATYLSYRPRSSDDNDAKSLTAPPYTADTNTPPATTPSSRTPPAAPPPGAEKDSRSEAPETDSARAAIKGRDPLRYHPRPTHPQRLKPPPDQQPPATTPTTTTHTPQPPTPKPPADQANNETPPESSHPPPSYQPTRRPRQQHPPPASYQTRPLQTPPDNQRSDDGASLFSGLALGPAADSPPWPACCIEHAAGLHTRWFHAQLEQHAAWNGLVEPNAEASNVC